MGTLRQMLSVFMLLILTSGVVGNPSQTAANTCKHNKLVSVLLKPGTKSAALSFCSSYIKVPKITKTVATVTSLTYIPASSNIAHSVGAARAAGATSTSTGLSAYLHSFAPSKISSACSCLSTSISKATKSVTHTATVSLCPPEPSSSGARMMKRQSQPEPGGYCWGDVAYCVTGSPIILRCESDTLQPGNCDDNLDEPPLGALCVESSDTAGDAVCSAVGSPAPAFPTPTGGLAALC